MRRMKVKTLIRRLQQAEPEAYVSIDCGQFTYVGGSVDAVAVDHGTCEEEDGEPAFHYCTIVAHERGRASKGFVL